MVYKGRRDYFFFFCLFRASSAAYGNSQARGRIVAVAASLHHSHGHSHTRSKPCLWPTSQLMACRILNPLSKARDWILILMDTSWVLNLLSGNGNSFFFSGQLFYSCLKVSRVSGLGIQAFQLNATLNISPEIMMIHITKALGYSIWLFYINFRKWKMLNTLHFLWVCFWPRRKNWTHERIGGSPGFCFWSSNSLILKICSRHHQHCPQSWKFVKAKSKIPTPRI